jgi:HAD superfamily hydrolase (TIGR01459 family)
MSAPASPEGDYGGVTALRGVEALARDHDGFIVDQWGVLHDGTKPYPGAIECLEGLHARGKRLVVLSNTGRREAEGIRAMAAMGFDPRIFVRFVAAGEDAREGIERQATPFHANLGRRYYAFTRDDNVNVMEGLGKERVGDPTEADFLAVLGIDSPPLTVADYEPLLAAGAARKLPMLCANPDLIRPSPHGVLDAPGALAQRYQELGGGEVFYHGKPYPAIYQSCVAALRGVPRERMVCVGDSIEHDILGASRAGLKSAFVAGGIHLDELGGAWGKLPSPAAWRRFVQQVETRPDYLLPAFLW